MGDIFANPFSGQLWVSFAHLSALKDSAWGSSVWTKLGLAVTSAPCGPGLKCRGFHSGFYTYSTRFIDPSWGFAMGYNYLLAWAFTLPLELTVCGIVVGDWDTSTSVGVWITVM